MSDLERAQLSLAAPKGFALVMTSGAATCYGIGNSVTPIRWPQAIAPLASAPESNHVVEAGDRFFVALDFWYASKSGTDLYAEKQHRLA